MFTRRKKVLLITLTVLPWVTIGLFVYVFFGQEYMYARSFASDLYHYPLPEKTKVIDKDFDYGVLFGGGPWGSGGRPTAVAFMEIESELDSKELYDYYNRDSVFTAPGEDTKNVGFELYLEGQYDKQRKDGKVWYERNSTQLITEEEPEKPIKAIVQIRTEFSYPFFIDWY